MARRKRDVSIGQRYFKSDATGIVWEVVNLLQGKDGLPYAQLARVDDTTMRKSVAVNELLQSSQYVPQAE